ncbi:hypothetical protein PENSPDRAFT_757509 [Peniophora sp. CONT]|nr:hypothetical protein PENSPDRAFT_757509 [Peniophora sp. CONT]
MSSIRSADDIPTSDINRVAGGHKANLSNANTSEESKQHSRAQLDELESSGRVGDASREHGEKNHGNVLGGFKATINNPNTGEEAKEKARNVLRENDAMEDKYE